MRNVFLYQSKAEPIALEGLPQPSHWFPQMPDIIPVAKALSAAVMAGSSFFTPVVAPPAETITPDKWLPSLQTPVWDTPQAPASLYAAPLEILTGEVITPDKWLPELEVPVLGLHLVREVVWSSTLETPAPPVVPDFISVDMVIPQPMPVVMNYAMGPGEMFVFAPFRAAWAIRCNILIGGGMEP